MLSDQRLDEEHQELFLLAELLGRREKAVDRLDTAVGRSLQGLVRLDEAVSLPAK